MSTIIIPQVTPQRLHPHRRCDNGTIVTWWTEAAIANGLNHVARWCTREAFRYHGQVNSITAKAGKPPRSRWRCAWHTGPYTTKMWVAFVAASAQTDDDPICRFTASNGELCEFHYGGGLGSTSNTPSTLGYGLRSIDVLPDTQYTGLFEDENDARLVGASVYEETFAPDTANGYLEPNAAVTGPIFDERRRAALAMADDLWSRGAHSFSLAVDTDAAARTRTSATDINLIDNTSTTVTANTPGVKLDYRYKRTRMQTTVPVRIRVCAFVAGGGTAHVYLKDSGGAVVATVTITGGTEAWHTTDALLPASESKYDLHFDSDGVNQVTVFAVSAYEHA